MYFTVYGPFKIMQKLSGRSLDDMQAGARVDENESKEDPRILLCESRQTGEKKPARDSPWGAGRPRLAYKSVPLMATVTWGTL
jgi:cysteinyl-tRNA synthetase